MQRLKDAGVETINHNLNTSANFTPEVVSTHTFEDRVDTVQAVKDAGMKTCSGGILGMGESDDDVIDLALSLRQLDVKSVPVNFLIPVPGTSFEQVRARRHRGIAPLEPRGQLARRNAAILFAQDLLVAFGPVRTLPKPVAAVSYTHLRAHETVLDLVCRLLLEKKTNKHSLYTATYSRT